MTTGTRTAAEPATPPAGTGPPSCRLEPSRSTSSLPPSRAGGSAGEAGKALEPGPRLTVTAVQDPATLRLSDGSEVRLLAILAPNSPDPEARPGTWPPEAHARAAVAELTVGRDVAFAPAGRRSDRYGRTLAHVFLHDEAAARWLQAEIVSLGHARVYAPPGGTACIAELLAFERTARAQHRGLWASAAYAPIPAFASGRLWRLRSTYQLVEGVVADVQQHRTVADVLFTSRTRRALRARIPLAAGNRGSLVPAGLLHRRIRVRGWLEWRHGPTLTVSDPALIEVLDQSP